MCEYLPQEYIRWRRDTKQNHSTVDESTSDNIPTQMFFFKKMKTTVCRACDAIALRGRHRDHSMSRGGNAVWRRHSYLNQNAEVLLRNVGQLRKEVVSYVRERHQQFGI